MAVKYYAVHKGRTTGIFFSWEACEKQVAGYPGAVYKSFPTIEEAEIFVRSGPQSVRKKSPADTPQKQAALQGFSEKGDAKENLPQKTEIEERLKNLKPGSLIAYVDGSYYHSTREFSYGMVLLDGEKTLSFCEKYADEELASMRNVAGEIKGAEKAMRYAVEHGFQTLYIYHDYEGIAKWCQGKWKTNKEGTKAYKAYYDSIRDRLAVEFIKVAAHTGDTYNEMADQLAKKALGI